MPVARQRCLLYVFSTCLVAFGTTRGVHVPPDPMANEPSEELFALIIERVILCKIQWVERAMCIACTSSKILLQRVNGLVRLT